MNKDVKHVSPFGDVMADNFHWVWDALNSGLFDKINLRGGSSSSKSWSTQQALLLYAVLNENTTIQIVMHSAPAIKKGAFKDVKEIIKSSEFIDSQIDRINQTDRIIYFINGSTISYNVYADELSARGPRYMITFCDEVNNIHENIFNQLVMRTTKLLLSSYNPSHPFYYSIKYLPNPCKKCDGLRQFNNKSCQTCKGYGVNLEDRNISFISNYKNNPFVTDVVVRELEGLKLTDYQLWLVYCCGLEGKIENQIFNYEETTFFPEQDFKWQCIGHDFGFSDPTATVLVRFYNQCIYVKQLLYDVKLSNKEAAELIKVQIEKLGLPPNIDVICDSAEPKSCEEFEKVHGLNVTRVKKGNGSINYGIGLIKNFKLFIDSYSMDLLQELKEYRFGENGKIVKTPDHLIDAFRYACMEKLYAAKKTSLRWLQPNAKIKDRIASMKQFKNNRRRI